MSKRYDDYKKWKENDMREGDMDFDDSNEIDFFIVI